MDPPGPVKHIHIFSAGLGDLVREPVRSIVLVVCLAAAVFPLAAAFGVSEGLREQAEISLTQAADITVSADVYGGEGPVSLTLLDELATLPGVVRAWPRIVGRTYFVDRVVAVVGLDEAGLRALSPVVRGRVPAARGEVLVGRGIAESFGVKPGMPFTLTANNRKVFTAVGTMDPSCLWALELLVMSVPDANEFFRTDGLATQVLLSVAQSGRESFAPPPRLRVHARGADERAYVSGFSWSHGIFTVLILVAMGLAGPAFLVTSGIGRGELRGEIGTLKALGWTTGEILEKTALEYFVASLMAASIATILCVLWMKGLNGFFIGQFFIAEVGLWPRGELPFRFLPIHGLACLAFALFVTETGGLYAAWAGSRIPPAEAMRR